MFWLNDMWMMCEFEEKGSYLMIGLYLMIGSLLMGSLGHAVISLSTSLSMPRKSWGQMRLKRSLSAYVTDMAIWWVFMLTISSRKVKLIESDFDPCYPLILAHSSWHVEIRAHPNNYLYILLCYLYSTAIQFLLQNPYESVETEFRWLSWSSLWNCVNHRGLRLKTWVQFPTSLLAINSL